jgi:hypothetical protein
LCCMHDFDRRTIDFDDGEHQAAIPQPNWLHAAAAYNSSRYVYPYVSFKSDGRCPAVNDSES